MNFLLLSILFFLGILSSIFSSSKKYNNKYILYFLIVAICAIIALRAVRVPDTDEYIGNFMLQADLFNTSVYPYEVGFVYLIHICHLFFGYHYQLFFFVIPLLNFWLLSVSFNKILSLYYGREINNKLKGLIILYVIYFSFFGLYYNAIVLRAGIAISFVMLSIVKIFESDMKGKIGIYPFIYFFAAFLFHMSSVCCIPIFLLSFRKKTLGRNSKLYALFTIFILYLFSPLLGIIMEPINAMFTLLSNQDTGGLSKFDYYNDSSLYQSSGISFKFLYFYLVAVVTCFFYRKSFVWNKLLDIYICGLLIWAIFRPIMLIERITDFYLVISVFILSIYYFDKKNTSTKFLGLFCTCCIQLLFIYRIIAGT